MNCPGCDAAMTAVALVDRSGAGFDVDVCPNCRAFWFDRFENTRLSSGSTVKLFHLMAEHPGSAAAPLRQPMPCPRCKGRLALVHDMQQRGTKFDYWRCSKPHGHFITFLQFLKEKDFVRPLTPKQIVELRQNVQMLECSNCGGPIDLVKQSTCPHCASPLTMIDMKQIAVHLRELEQDAAAPPPEPSRTSETVKWTVRGVRFEKHTETVRGSRSTTSSFSARSNQQADVKGLPDADRMFAEAMAAMSRERGSKSLTQAGLGIAIRWLNKK